MCNEEALHPKSCYFTFDSANNIMKAGPVWDFDWAALYESQADYCFLTGFIYYNALFKSSVFIDEVKEVWDNYSSDIEIDNKIEELRDYLSVAANYDAKKWGVNHNPFDMQLSDFNAHVDFLKTLLDSKMETVDAEISAM